MLDQYRRFFSSLTPLSTMTYKARFTAMQKLAVDPELTQVMGGLAAAEHAGEVFYGAPVVRPEVLSVSGNTAVLSDCQDTSGNGRMNMMSKNKVTVGRVDDLAKVTMQRGSDGVWRVKAVEYAPVGSCHAAA